jgi:benzoyl-CoA reductase/2-hydroxyglutaryl-CoA dehydratase subunit BcrC/BadD/HgdB
MPRPSELKGLQVIRAAVARRPQELAEARRAGAKVVGWLNYNIPEELIHALGLIPVRLGWGGDDRLVDLGARFISTKNCVFVRQTIGEFSEGKNPYIQNLDLVALDATCIQVFRVAELIKYYFKANTLVLGVPRNFATPEGLTYFEAELAHFTGKLEAFAGTPLDLKKLEASVRLYDRIRAGVRALYAYQAGDDAAINWREAVEVVQASNFLDKAHYAQLLGALLEELHAAQGTPVIRDAHREVRLFLSGSLIPPGDSKLVGIIEELGGRIVGDDLWSSLNHFTGVEVKDISVRGLAQAYLRRVPHCALPYLDLESDGRIRNLKSLIRDFKAQAVVYHTLRYCDPFTFKANETKEVLKGVDVPFLEIHTEYASSDYEAIRTRVEAFVELLRNRNALVEA